ncbi:MAG: hypothetical protein PF495_21545, partial [Spirochaetales bacterium]|nr:hypothetical protein [Spirochaetales bacterium]
NQALLGSQVFLLLSLSVQNLDTRVLVPTRLNCGMYWQKEQTLTGEQSSASFMLDQRGQVLFGHHKSLLLKSAGNNGT